MRTIKTELQMLDDLAYGDSALVPTMNPEELCRARGCSDPKAEVAKRFKKYKSVLYRLKLSQAIRGKKHKVV